MLLVGQKGDLDVRIARARQVLRRQLFGLNDLHRQRHLVEVVADAELYPAELLAADKLRLGRIEGRLLRADRKHLVAVAEAGGDGGGGRRLLAVRRVGIAAASAARTVGTDL